MTDTTTAAVEAEPIAATELEPVDNHDAAEIAAAGDTEEPEPTAEAEPEPTDPAEPAAEGDPEQPPKKESWERRRFRQENAKRHAAERELAELKARIAANATPEVEPPARQSENLTQAQVDQRAREIVEQNQFVATRDATFTAGEKAFGKAEFLDACNTLADLGANDKPEFLHAVLGEENGHKILQHLGQDADEAERILALPPIRMASAIAKLSVKLDQPKATPVSAAPAPIKPLDGRARVEPTMDKMDDDQFTKMFEEKRAARRAR